MFKSLSLRLKLSLAFLLVAGLVSGMGLYQVRALHDADTLFLDLIDNDFARRDTLAEVKIAAAQAEKVALSYKDLIAAATNAQSSVTEKTKIDAEANKLDGLFMQYQSQLSGDTQQHSQATVLAALQQKTAAFISESKAYIDVTNQKPAAVIAQYQELEQASNELTQKLDELIKIEADQIEAENAKVDAAVSNLLRITALLIAAVTAAAVMLGLVLSQALTRPLKKLKVGALRLANGDFSQPVIVKTHDEIGQLASTFNDMSTRLRDSYRRLAVETERDKTLLESLGEGAIAIDEQTNIVLINDKAIEILELPAREKLIGIPVNHAFTVYDEHDKPLSGNKTPTLTALETKQTINSVLGFHKQSGAKVLLAVSANPVIVEEKIAGAMMTIRDVTKEKEIDRMKTEFISLASHQLRTPLSAIKWFSEMLVSGDAGKLKADQLDFAKNIADSTERMIALVNALLNISRIESGRILIDPKPTDLRELVSGIVNDLKAKTEERKQTLIISVHQDLPKINIDPRLIGQVYLNLLTNAIKYTPKGGEVSVLISRKEDQIISQVTDNGYGIPKDQQDRVFQKFFRAANAVKVETDGTGLGLYLIKAVVESSGGKIWFESTEGKGTTFWFSIPASGMQAKEGEVTLDM